MIFRRAAQREFVSTAAGIFVALFAILITTQSIRLLSQAAGGRLASEAVVALLGFAALNYLPVVLSLTVFIAILLSLSRTYRDSEMTVWFSSGLPLTAWVGPVLRFAVPIVLLIALLSLFLSPWAVGKSLQLRERLQSRDDVAQVSPGSFRESSAAERVFFVEAIAEDASRVRNVFVSSVQHGRLGVMVAEQGYTETAANGDRFLVLLNGRRYEGAAGTPDYRAMEFVRYAVRIEAREGREVKESPKSAKLISLLRDPSGPNQGELLWRVGIPLSALSLALLAIPLSFVNPRAGRANNLILAILVYMTYSNMIGLCQAWVAQGRLPFSVGFWVVHVLMFVLMIVLFHRRMAIYSWLRLRR